MTIAEAISALFNAIISGLTEVPIAMVNAIKELFTSFVFDNYGEETQALSFIGYFLMAMLGLAIGVGLVWLVISLFKRRK